MIPSDIPSFEELGLPPIAEWMARLPRGLVLMTGPTGSGKSTTLASIIDRINETRALHILTIEDPVEYVHDHGLSAVNQREIGLDSPSFERALRSALREDPDVLLVGEMRDLESIQLALTLAETGHLVFSTLHTNDAAQAIDRIIDVFPAFRQEQIRVQLACVAGRRHRPDGSSQDRRRHGRCLRGSRCEQPREEPDPGGQDQPAAERDHHESAGGHVHAGGQPGQPDSSQTSSPTTTPWPFRRTPRSSTAC